MIYVQGDADGRSRPAGTQRADDSRGQSCYSSPSKAGAPEPGSRRSSACGSERPSSAKAKARRSPAAAPAGLGGHAGMC